MPLYEYLCPHCHALDTRVAGFDDWAAICLICGGLMARLTDPFAEAQTSIDPQNLSELKIPPGD